MGNNSSYALTLAKRLQHIVEPGADDIAQDARQETWLRLAARPPELGRQTTRELRQHVQRRIRWRSADAARRNKRYVGSEETVISALSREDGPPRATERRELNVVIRKAVRKLSRLDRKIFRLRFWSGKSLQEIATELDMPLSTVSSRMYRGIQCLKSCRDVQLYEDF